MNKNINTETEYSASANMSSPVVSICLPVYNGERYLKMAISSALKQSTTDLELLISDDASTDGSWDIIQSYAEKDKRIKAWKNEKRLGLFANYNSCIQASTGRYIKLFAQDDFLEMSAVEKMLKVLDENEEVALVACAKKFIDESDRLVLPVNDEERRVCQAFLEDTEITADEAISSTIVQPLNWLGEPSTVMFRKVHAGSGFDTRFSQLGDLDYWYRILEFGNYFYLSEKLCQYRRHENSTTVANTFNLLSTVDIFLLITKYSKRIIDQGSILTDFCSAKVEDAADWTRFIVENKFIVAFPEFFDEGVFDPHKPYKKDNDMLLVAYRLMAFHALACASRQQHKLVDYLSELERQNEVIERNKKHQVEMDEDSVLLSAEVKRLKAENNKKREEILLSNAENLRLRNKVLDLQKKVARLEKGRTEAVNEIHAH